MGRGEGLRDRHEGGGGTDLGAVNMTHKSVFGLIKVNNACVGLYKVHNLSYTHPRGCGPE